MWLNKKKPELSPRVKYRLEEDYGPEIPPPASPAEPLVVQAPQSREAIYLQRLSLIRNCYGDLFDAEFTAAEPRRDEREAFEKWATQVGLNISGAWNGKEMDYHINGTWWGWKAWQAARASAPLPQTPGNIEELAELLHVWYLEATRELNPESVNPNAQKSYADLSDEQKFIDRYIAYKVWLRTQVALPQPSAGQTEQQS